ncbi:hypothetical protein F5Y04DRAFT_292314 [Hypomontagnella monticulosa]|nr:hypothetical protein F5Y04DRAFT_292314 [Hypomontagnella monticulosa]
MASATEDMSTCYLLQVPKDVFLEIFSWFEEPYTQEGYVPEYELARSREGRHEICWDQLFLIPEWSRTWKSMSIFHVCRAFRNVAIEHYGQPSQHMLPFDPQKDELRLRAISRGSAVSLGLAVGRGLSPPAVVREQAVEIRGRIHYYHLLSQSLTTERVQPLYTQHPKHAYLQRITRVRISMADALRRFTRSLDLQLERFPSVLSVALPNLQELEITPPYSIFEHWGMHWWGEDGTVLRRLPGGDWPELFPESPDFRRPRIECLDRATERLRSGTLIWRTLRPMNPEPEDWNTVQILIDFIPRPEETG